jgi:hypothetical protein
MADHDGERSARSIIGRGPKTDRLGRRLVEQENAESRWPAPPRGFEITERIRAMYDLPALGRRLRRAVEGWPD